ncbi:MAG: NYN domain-containing protein [Candidatus Liptonbacteria bacterium]|nr:NYN domain-containing protein [Candidatus Liptonbacteria bacterium]
MIQSKFPERVAVYIDGANFYRRLKDPQIRIPVGKIFDYSKFVENLVNGRTLISKRYYTGIVRNTDNTQKSADLVKHQQKFLTEIQNEEFVIKRGRIMYEGIVREKGVDVKIATDLLIGAVDNLYDTAVIVSSDTDLIPALEYIKYKKKKIEYVGFSHRPSLGMQKYADINILLQKKDIEVYLR